MPRLYYVQQTLDKTHVSYFETCSVPVLNSDYITSCRITKNTPPAGFDILCIYNLE